MAAEKLTKARLVQIIVVLIILLGAFFWRTVTHEECVNNKSLNSDKTECQLKTLITILQA